MYKLVDRAIHQNSSDIHLNEGLYPAFRINGKIEGQKELEIVEAQDMKAYLKSFLSEEKLDAYKKDKQTDSVLDYRQFRLRIHAYRQKEKDSISIRILSKKIPSFEFLNLPESIIKFTNINSGLVLITGKTGTGKSTTLSSIINHINQNHRKKIISLEDPIEYIYQDDKSIINQREISRDVSSYEAGIISLLRSDPDIIVLGELRDLETIKSAMTLSETGHLVFATLHTRSASETINRIIDIFPSEGQNQIRIQLSQVLEGIVSQDLIYSKKNQKRLPVCEILIPNVGIRNSIRNIAASINIEDQILMLSSKNGSQTRLQSLIYLIKNNLLDLEDTLEYVDDKDREIIKEQI